MHRFMERLARVMAALGGLVLSSLIIVTCLSVLGRVLNTVLHGWIGTLAPGASQALLDLGVGPILGDFELVEAGVAFAIFAFMPLCQISAGHASVDLLTNMLGPRTNRFLQMVIDIVFAVALILIAVKLYDGLLAKRRYGETTFLLQFPIWWSYAASLFAASIGALAGVYVAIVRCVEFATGKSILNGGSGAEA